MNFEEFIAKEDCNDDAILGHLVCAYVYPYTKNLAHAC